MKLYWVGFLITTCASYQFEGTFPEEELKMVDPVGPAKEHAEILHRQAVVEYESITVNQCLRSIYRGETAQQRTVLITRHCVEENHGWFYAVRYLDENKNNQAEKWCYTVGETVVGGIHKQEQWKCFASKEELDGLVRQAERWLNDPSDTRW